MVLRQSVFVTIHYSYHTVVVLFPGAERHSDAVDMDSGAHRLTGTMYAAVRSGCLRRAVCAT